MEKSLNKILIYYFIKDSRTFIAKQGMAAAVAVPQ